MATVGGALSSWLLLAVLASAAGASVAATAVVDPVSYLKDVSEPSYTVADVWKNFKPAPNHDEIVASAPDTWEVLPKELDPKYRNPCWTDDNNRFRCMPYFQILGVSKCGTTDLFARLKRHPELADGSKGPHFWDECPYPPRTACTAPPNGDFNGYVDLFEKGAYQMKTNPIMITGEASSNTFTGVYTFVRGLAVRRGINVTLADLIHEAQPYQRLIVIMRDPISRYYSAFHYYGHKKSEGFAPAEKFHERAVTETQRWNECVEKSGLAFCLKRYDPQQLIKGMYAEFVEPWLRVFPKEQVLFLRSEDYKAAPREHLTTVLRFLGMRDLTDDEWERMTSAKRANAQSSRYPRMLPETRELLEKFFAPYNAKLAKMLGDERYLWNDVRQASEASPAVA
uniref:Sulfotransferase n=1 Tax=Chlamydomonas euryale TaxID=1486919 RepID=A0A7R9YQ49_9CHLO|mmetsp:Transcript_10147/g.30607  ORF Transcript_10147/g.30607 Transcript_10147/m.30607 type:complete len:397 (+) Transcript_10147:187-1377(+)